MAAVSNAVRGELEQRDAIAADFMAVAAAFAGMTDASFAAYAGVWRAHGMEFVHLASRNEDDERPLVCRLRFDLSLG